MPWIISFIASWILFFLLVDYKSLKSNLIGGLLALILASFVDWGGQKLDLYKFKDLIIPWFGCSAFYKFGPIVVMGILFVQSIPQKRYMQALNILMFSICFIALEIAIINTGVAVYIHWHYIASFFFDILLFCAFTWLSEAFINRRKIS